MYDLIVIGAGPGGYEAAAHAGKLGAKVAVVEKQHCGGTCLNAGCIPAKTLLRSSRLFAECRNAAAYGIRVQSVSFDMPAVLERKNRIVGRLAKGVESLLKRSGVKVIWSEAQFASRNAVRIRDEILQAKNILIATGSKPAVPAIKGGSSEHVLDSTGVLNLATLPSSAVIIGGGYIGLEFASFLAAVRTRVTLFETLPQIAPGADHEISTRLQQALQNGGVEVKTSCTVTSIDGDTVHYARSDGSTAHICTECVINAAGRTPALDGLDLERIGIDFDRRGIRTSDRGKTNIPGVWACGDVTGRRLLAHAAAREGIVAVNNMLGRRDRIRYDSVPSVIYSHPEIASVGATEDELKAQGIGYKKAALPMSIAGRFLVENEGGAGLIKVLAGAEYGEILGVHAIGDWSSEFIVAAAAMIEQEICASDVSGIVFPHPTVSEALKSAILELK